MTAHRITAEEMPDDEIVRRIMNASRRSGYVDFDPEDISEGDKEIVRELVRDIRDSLRAELGSLRSAPVAVEVPELTERDEELLRCVERALDKSPSMFDGYMGDGMRAWEASIALDSAIRVGRAIPSDRVLKEGEREELDILRQVAKLIDDKRNAQWEKRGAGPCQRMPDEIDNLLCDWYEIQAQREFNALRSQRTENEGPNHHVPN